MLGSHWYPQCDLVCRISIILEPFPRYCALNDLHTVFSAPDLRVFSLK